MRWEGGPEVVVIVLCSRDGVQGGDACCPMRQEGGPEVVVIIVLGSREGGPEVVVVVLCSKEGSEVVVIVLCSREGNQRYCVLLSYIANWGTKDVNAQCPTCPKYQMEDYIPHMRAGRKERGGEEKKKWDIVIIAQCK
ncbi:hypothetical protein BDQ17DRAFT_1337379 [Cyathus striatus]|nr:hypothetical protein BDQ17DRAFT_1337379 [Cyathus striatus]